MGLWSALIRASWRFARECGFFPRACNPAAGWEKGKVERGGVGYVRQNFWPLRQFTDLSDVNRQAREWLDGVANQRLHRETRQRPCERFRPDCLRPLPALTPDYRDTAEALVYKDLRLQFDGNRYCAPPHLVGQHLTVKADASSVALYHRNQEIVRYPRCWRRGQTLGAERFEKELLAHRAAAHRSQAQRRLIALLVSDCSQETVEAYLRGLADSNRCSLPPDHRTSPVDPAVRPRSRGPQPSRRPLPPAPLEPITSLISCGSNSRPVILNPLCNSAIPS